ncbi:MAG TPA: response regulator, partial [Herpetosiphonaceae bacterium]|nr:response regulator [Herpetosiphonaceae bacterium]
GTGLGLAMVHGIVSQSGGYIEVASQPDQGCTFAIYLPETAADDTQVRRAPPGTPAPGGSETVLLVEDDEAVRKLAKGILSKYGYIVLDAPDGPAALDIVQTYGHIDLLLTDVIMPGGLSGIQLARLLLKKRPLLKVLYISGYTDNMLDGEENAGPDAGFLQKPFTADSLTRKVRGVLDSQAAER